MEKIHARAIIEILGSPKEHVDSTMQMINDQVKHYKDFKILKEKTFAAEKMGDKPLFNTFTEFELETNDVQTLIGFCFDFMPSSLEIIKPEDLLFKHHDVSDFLNDLLARLHQYDMVLKSIHAENILLKEKTGTKDQVIKKKK